MSFYEILTKMLVCLYVYVCLSHMLKHYVMLTISKQSQQQYCSWQQNNIKVHNFTGIKRVIKLTGTGVCSSSMRNFLGIGMIRHSERRDVPAVSHTLLCRATFDDSTNDFMSLVRKCCKISRSITTFSSVCYALKGVLRPNKWISHNYTHRVVYASHFT